VPNPTRLRVECLGDIVSGGFFTTICSCCFCETLCSSSVHLRKVSHVSGATKEVLMQFFTSKCFWWLHAYVALSHDCHFCKNVFLSSGIRFQCIDADIICEVSERIDDLSYGNCDKYRLKLHFHCECRYKYEYCKPL